MPSLLESDPKPALSSAATAWSTVDKEVDGTLEVILRATGKQSVSFPPVVPVPKRGDYVPELTDDQRKDIAVLTAQRDEDIDYSDIPPIREIPSNAERGRFYRGPAIYLTGDVHAYLSRIALRRGVPLNDLVDLFLTKEIALIEELK